MKEDELRSVATCALCKKKIGAVGVPLFWRVTVERFGLDAGAIQRVAGMEQFFRGNVALARVFGADEDVARPVMEPVRLTVCEACCTQSTCIAALAEARPAAETARDEDEAVAAERSEA